MSEVADRPSSVEVTLGNGNPIKVGSLDWKGYKELKPKIVEALASRTMGVLEDPSLASGGPEAMAPIMMALDEVMGEMTVGFVTACVADRKSLKGITAPVDWLKLRQAAAEVNDLTAILELEGNALAASVKLVMDKMGDLTPEDNTEGG